MVRVLIPRQMPDRTWQIIDRHMLADTGGHGPGPVLWVDLTYKEVENPIATGHPGMIEHLKRSPAWRVTSLKRSGAPKAGWRQKRDYKTSTGRAVVSAE